MRIEMHIERRLLKLEEKIANKVDDIILEKLNEIK